MCYLLLLGGHASVEAADPGWSCRLGELALGVSSMEWIWAGEESGVLNCTLPLFTDCRYSGSILQFP